MKYTAILLLFLIHVAGVFAQTAPADHDYTFDVPEGNYKVTLVVGSKDRPVV